MTNVSVADIMASQGAVSETAMREAQKVAKGFGTGFWQYEDSCQKDNQNNEWLALHPGLSSNHFAWGNRGIEVYDNSVAWQSGFGPRAAVGRNAIMSVEFKGYYANLFMREVNKDNLAFVQVSSAPNFRTGPRQSGSFALQKDIAITYNGTDWGRLVGKTFGNGFFCALYINGSYVRDYLWTSAYFTTPITGTKNGVAGGTLAQNGGNPAQYRNFKFKKIKSLLNVICLGDSNTVGSSTAAYNPGIGNVYPSLLNQRYIDDPITVYNAGVSGNTLTQMQARLSTDVQAKMITGATNVVIIMGGVNDMNHDLDTGAETYTTLTGLISAVQALSPDHLAVVTYPPYRSPAQEELIAYNAAIRAGADALGHDVIEVHPYMTDGTDAIDSKLCYTLSGEGYHYNAAGHQVIAGLVDKYLMSL